MIPGKIPATPPRQTGSFFNAGPGVGAWTWWMAASTAGAGTRYGDHGRIASGGVTLRHPRARRVFWGAGETTARGKETEWNIKLCPTTALQRCALAWPFNAMALSHNSIACGTTVPRGKSDGAGW